MAGWGRIPRLARAVVLLSLVAAGPARHILHREAYGPPTPPTTFDLCDDAIAVARGPAIPAMLLPAIGRVESGRLDPRTGQTRPWPWTINVEGVGSFFDTKAEAVAAVQAIQARGQRSVDVGCMQVNLFFHPNAFADLETAFDPLANATYAARFLTALYGQSKDWNLATAAYHSQTQERGEDYQRRVFGRVMTPMGPAFPAGLMPKFPAPGVMFGALPPNSMMFGAMPPAGSLFAALPPASLMFGAFNQPSPPVAKPGRRIPAGEGYTTNRR